MILTDKNNSHWFEDCQIAINMGYIPTHTLTSTFFFLNMPNNKHSSKCEINYMSEARQVKMTCNSPHFCEAIENLKMIRLN